jgi:mannose-6-phosphate isomerase-like protein (cupin superfamily)
VSVGGNKEILRAGDAYYFDSSLPHRFRNPGDQECELISANTPPTF